MSKMDFTGHHQWCSPLVFALIASIHLALIMQFMQLAPSPPMLALPSIMKPIIPPVIQIHFLAAPQPGVPPKPVESPPALSPAILRPLATATTSTWRIKPKPVAKSKPSAKLAKKAANIANTAKITRKAEPQADSVPVVVAPAPVVVAPSIPAKIPDPVVTTAPEPITAVRYNAAYLQNPAPTYPVLSRRLREEGKVVLHVYVLPNGQAHTITIQHSSGYERLDKAAQAAVRTWRFIPAQKGNMALAAWVIIPVVFNLDHKNS